MSLIKFVFVVLVTVLTGCTDGYVGSSLASLTEIHEADPVKDAERSLKRNDFRFIAVHNHDLIMPLNIKPCLVEIFDYRLLSNQSFDYGSYDFQKYGALATLYSNWYNFTVLSYLEANNLDQCDSKEG